VSPETECVTDIVSVITVWGQRVGRRPRGTQRPLVRPQRWIHWMRRAASQPRLPRQPLVTTATGQFDQQHRWQWRVWQVTSKHHLVTANTCQQVQQLSLGTLQGWQPASCREPTMGSWTCLKLRTYFGLRTY